MIHRLKGARQNWLQIGLDICEVILQWLLERDESKVWVKEDQEECVTNPHYRAAAGKKIQAMAGRLVTRIQNPCEEHLKKKRNERDIHKASSDAVESSTVRGPEGARALRGGHTDRGIKCVQHITWEKQQALKAIQELNRYTSQEGRLWKEAVFLRREQGNGDSGTCIWKQRVFWAATTGRRESNARGWADCLQTDWEKGERASSHKGIEWENLIWWIQFVWWAQSARVSKW